MLRGMRTADDCPASHILSLRPVGQHAGMRRAAARAGLRVLALSPWTLQANDDDTTRRALQAALACRSVIVTSPAAVAAAAALTDLAHSQVRDWLAVGASTRGALQRHGLVGAQAPHRMDSEGLLAMPALHTGRISGQPVGMLTAPEGRGHLQAELAARGARLVQANVYRRVPTAPSAAALKRLQALGDTPWLALSSAQALHTLLAQLPRPIAAQLRQCRVVAASARLVDRAVEQGWARARIVQAASARPADLVQAIVHASSRGVSPGAGID